MTVDESLDIIWPEKKNSSGLKATLIIAEEHYEGIVMTHKLKLDGFEPMTLHQGPEDDRSDIWHCVIFFFDCDWREERLMVKVKISNLAIMNWSESREETEKRAYSFVRRNLSKKLTGGLNGVRNGLQEDKLLEFKIKNSDQAQDKLTFIVGETFKIEI